jgi:hypothetical protein
MRFWSSCSLFLSFSVASWRPCCCRFEAEELGKVDMPLDLHSEASRALVKRCDHLKSSLIV